MADDPLSKDELNEFTENLAKFSYVERFAYLENCSIEMLELLASNFYKKIFWRDEDKILKEILRERHYKLNKIFEWSDANKQAFLNVNDKILQVFEKTYNKAISIACELEDKIENNDSFLKDYEIGIFITPYMDEKYYDETEFNIEYVLSEPESKFSLIHETISHSLYDKQIKEKPIYLDRSSNWNIENLKEPFKDNYINYLTYDLMHRCYWSFCDFIRIKDIWADIEVTHQYYEEV